MTRAVRVPADVLEGIAACRESGAYNMLDRPGVQRWCSDAGYYAAVLWIEENRASYGAGIFNGFEVELTESRRRA